MIFQTPRLIARPLKETDQTAYFDMMGNPKVMNPIPQKPMTREESNAHLNKMLNLDPKTSDIKVWAIELKEEKVFIGLCAFLKNNNNEDEIGYRLREAYWGVGFGTEITRGLIDYGFNVLKTDLITADVFIENVPSVKILEKFFTRDIEFFNEDDNCYDRRYKLRRDEWEKSKK